MSGYSDFLVSERKRYKGTCKDCSGPLELVDVDFKRNTKVLGCKRCGLLHLYKKNIIGWKLARITKQGSNF